MKTNRRPQSQNKPNMPIGLVIFIDLLFIGIGLVIFALFHHVLPGAPIISGEILPRPTTTQSLPLTTSGETTSSPSGLTEETLIETTMPTTASYGQWGARFADQFTAGEIIRTENSYRSENIAITIEKVQREQVTFYVANIYLRDIDYFRSAFAGGVFARGRTDTVPEMADENNAILAISGDYFGIRSKGIVIRNGELYRDVPFEDVLVLYYDGTMQTYTRQTFNLDEVKAKGAWQAWSFGPMLLDNGQVMETFNSDVAPRNPRGAIGYFEPGHYCFVLVDGRQENYSIGLTLRQMSQLFFDLGCRVAYNLDGGQSAMMTFMSEIVNQPYNGGRPISDIIYIGE